MEIGLQKAETAFYRNCDSGGMTFEACSEMVVPDVMPDIGEIVYASGIPLLRSKALADGRINVSGSVQTQILYVPESDMSVHKLELEIPFSYSGDVSAAEESLFTANVRVAFMDARALNPRKISVRCELCAEYNTFEAAQLCINSDLQPGVEADICAKRETVTADLVSGVYEKSFIVTDSYPLTGSQDVASELLSRNVTVSGEDVKLVGTKAILKGILQTELIWRTEEGEICATSFSSGFSQILEIGELEQPSVDFCLTLTGAYFELQFTANDSRTVSTELHVLAQVVCSQRKEISYISDVYSNRYPLQAVFCAQQALCTADSDTRRDSMRGVVDMPWHIREILYVTAGIGLWSASETGYTCPINVRLLLRDEEGGLHGLVRSFAAKWDAVEDGCDSETVKDVICEELTAMPAPDGAEIRMLAVAKLRRSRVVRITPLETAEMDVTARLDLTVCPSVTVLPDKDGDLWTLAKRYHSTVELIEKDNRDAETSVLLIPRAR